MRVFLDTNVVIDVAQGRPGAIASAAVLRAAQEHGNAGIVAWHTLSNLFYLMRRHYSSSQTAAAMIADLLLWVEVAGGGSAAARRAVALDYHDFEDALQMAAAEAAAADCIVTRNAADFTGGEVPVFTPEAFLSRP